MSTSASGSAISELASGIRDRRVWLFFALIFLVDCYLYFWAIGHFFQADAVFLLHHRPLSIGEYLEGFLRLHASGWYRPLSNFFELILFPLAGLKPAVYRIPVYAVFLAISVAIYILVFRLSKRHLTAGLAMFVFSIHTVNAYVTYDIAFMPELFYTFFYIAAVFTYLIYIERGARSALWLSLGCFVLSLVSKEAAVTLPGTLVAVTLLGGGYHRQGNDKRWSSASRVFGLLLAVRWHVLILVCYLLFVIGYLNVGGISFATMFKPRPDDLPPSSYDFVLDKGILENVDTAMTWAFNIPRGWSTLSHQLPNWLVVALKSFRFVALAITLVLLFRPERRLVLLGIAWFFLTVIPSLPLINHFLPHYLFLPIAGFSLLLGVVVTSVYDWLSRLRNVAPVALAVCLSGLVYGQGINIHADIERNLVLGRSASLASSSLAELKTLHPALPSNAIVYIIDDREPLWWHHDLGGLLKMAYDRSDLTVLYSSYGQNLPLNPAPERFILLRFENNRLHDRTTSYRADPYRFINYKNQDERRLVLSAGSVATGDSYSLQISGHRNVVAHIAYTYDGGPVKVFDTGLDSEGYARFDISPATPRGVYQFVGFNIEGEEDWLRSGESITVR